MTLCFVTVRVTRPRPRDWLEMQDTIIPRVPSRIPQIDGIFSVVVGGILGGIRRQGPGKGSEEGEKKERGRERRREGNCRFLNFQNPTILEKK